MNEQTKSRPAFWETVAVLLRASRKRSEGRRKRQQELLNSRSEGRGADWGGVIFLFFGIFMLFIHGTAAICVDLAVKAAQRVEVERQGKVAVTSDFLRGLRSSSDEVISDTNPYSGFANQAKRISDQYGGSSAEIERKLRRTFEESGTENFVSTDEASPGLSALGRSGAVTALVGSIALLWWALMLTFQGEGLEMDVQRRRHPMWEWLLSHPIPPGAVFLAEMLSPIAANPTYWGAPLFTGILYGLAYNPGAGFIAAFLIGAPPTVAAA